MIEYMRYRLARLERLLLDHLHLVDFPSEPDSHPEGDDTPPLYHRVRRLETMVLRQQQEIEKMSDAQTTANQDIEKLTADEAAMKQRVGQNTVDAAHQAQLQQDIAGLEGVDAPASTTTPPTTTGTPAAGTPATSTGDTTSGTTTTPTTGQ